MKLEFAGAGLGAHRKIPEMTFYVWALEQEKREGTNPTKARLEQTSDIKPQGPGVPWDR